MNFIILFVSWQRSRNDSFGGVSSYEIIIQIKHFSSNVSGGYFCNTGGCFTNDPLQL